MLCEVEYDYRSDIEQENLRIAQEQEESEKEEEPEETQRDEEGWARLIKRSLEFPGGIGINKK